MAETKKSVFDLLNSVNVNEHTENKNGLTYLSWAWAWAEVKKRYPDASYEIEKFNGIPYAYDPLTGYMVYTKVTIEGITHEMWLPVMDGNNRAMKAEPYKVQTKYKTFTVEPATMFDVNKTIMRCLTKNLAMFGLGLYIYTGEDLPETEEPETVETPKAETPKVAPTKKTPAKKTEQKPAPAPAPAPKTEQFPNRNKFLKICHKNGFDVKAICDDYGLTRDSKDSEFEAAVGYVQMMEGQLAVQQVDELAEIYEV